MATSKKDLTDPRVQGHSITLGELQRRLGCTAPEARRFLSGNNISCLRIGKRTVIDVDEVDRALERREVATPAEESPLRLAAAELVRRSRAKQGLPPQIEDPEVYGRIVALLQPIADED